MTNIPAFYAENAEFRALLELCEVAGFPVVFEDKGFSDCLAFAKGEKIHFPTQRRDYSRFESPEHSVICLGHELKHVLDSCLGNGSYYDRETDRTGYSLNESLATAVGTYFCLLARALVCARYSVDVDVDALDRELKESSRKAAAMAAARLASGK